MFFASFILATVSTASNAAKIFGISPDILISSGVTIFITILGFIVTYRASRKNLLDEIMKFKQTSQVDQAKDLPLELCSLLQKIYDKAPQDELNKSYAELMNKVLSFASKDAVKIAIWGQKVSFEMEKTGNKNAPLVALSLLISQLKYDFSSVVIPADAWFQIRVSNYHESGMKLDVEQIIECVVQHLDLNRGFIPDKKKIRITFGHTQC